MDYLQAIRKKFVILMFLFALQIGSISIFLCWLGNFPIFDRYYIRMFNHKYLSNLLANFLLFYILFFHIACIFIV